MFNIAMVSRWHTHAQEDRYVNQLKNIPEAKITAVWDFDVKRGKIWADELGVDFEENYDKLLARDDVDGICICTPTAMHKDVIIKAAKAHKHIFTEKALAMNYEEALEIHNAVKEAGVELGIAFPRRGNRDYLAIKKMCEKGELGDIVLVRIRNAVTNAAPIADSWFKEEKDGGGGGVIRDLGCHNIDVACWFLGEPDTISVTEGHVSGMEVADTGVCNIKFKNGAIAMIDSTYSAPLSCNWYSLEIYGSKKVLLADVDTVTVIESNGEIVADKQIIKVCDFEPGFPIPIQQWINACIGKGENICDVDAGVMVNRVLDAAELAKSEQRTVKI